MKMAIQRRALPRVAWAWIALAAIAAPGAEAAPGRWSSAGPYGGRIDSAVASPLEPGVLFASAHRSVYRSADNGVSWSFASAGLSTLSAGETVLKAHPTQPGRLLLAGARGVFISLNSGRSWQRRDSGLPVNSSSFRTVDVSFSATDPARIYLATAKDGLYRSLNGGGSWSAVATGDLPGELDHVAADPLDNQKVLVWAGKRGGNGAFSASLYRSSNGGSSFTPVFGPWNSGGDIDDPVDLLAYNGNTPNTVFLAGRFGNYRSLDGGSSFSSLSSLPVASTQRLQSLAFDPAVAGRLLFGTSDGVLISTDNGGTFVPRNGGLSVTAGDPASIGAVLIDPVDNSRWLAFSLAGEVFASGNAGLSWIPTSAGLRGTAIQTVAVHPARPQRVYAGLRNERGEATSPALYQSDDGAASWSRFNAALALDTVNAISFDLATVTTPATTRMYAVGADFAPAGQPASSYRGGVFKSLDGGLTWTPADALVPTPIAGPASVGEVHALLIDPGSVTVGTSQTLYFGARGLLRCAGGVPVLDVARLWRSSDAATTWTARDGLPLGECLPRNQYPMPVALAFDPGSSNVLYAGTRLQGYCLDCGDPLPTQSNGVYKSTDAGLSWSAVNTGLPLMSGTGSTFDVAALVAVPGQPGTLYVALNDPSQEDAPGRVFKTVNGGLTWVAADAGINGVSVRSLKIDPSNTSRIYAGAGGLETTPGGVYVSEDAGLGWASISIDLPIDSAQSVALSFPVAGAPTVHAGTDEGVWSLSRVPDVDIDGPPDATENLAPNSGDGNADGMPDRQQTNVASFEIPSAFGAGARGGSKQGTLSNVELLRVGACQQVYDAAAIDPLSLPEDDGLDPVAGILRFEFVGCTNATVQIIFHDEVFGPDWRFRRYGPASVGNPTTLGWLNMGNAAVRSGNVWTLTLADNTPGDLRREVGRILFVGGPLRATQLFRDGFE